MTFTTAHAGGQPEPDGGPLSAMPRRVEITAAYLISGTHVRHRLSPEHRQARLHTAVLLYWTRGRISTETDGFAVQENSPLVGRVPLACG